MDLREQLAQVKGKLSLLRAEFPVPADELPDEFFAREEPLRAEQQRLRAAIYDSPEAKRERAAIAKASAKGRHVVGHGHYPELLSEDPKELRRCADFTRLKTGSSSIRHFSCDDGTFHLLQWIENGKPVSGLTLKAERPWRGKQSATIDTVFTAETHRRQGLAAALLSYARTYFRKVAHSKDLTDQGRAWKKAVRNGPMKKNADERRRGLERRAKSGTIEDQARVLAERVRSGDLTQDRVDMAAALGDPVAKIVAPDAPAFSELAVSAGSVDEFSCFVARRFPRELVLLLLDAEEAMLPMVQWYTHDPITTGEDTEDEARCRDSSHVGEPGTCPRHRLTPLELEAWRRLFRRERQRILHVVTPAGRTQSRAERLAEILSEDASLRPPQGEVNRYGLLPWEHWDIGNAFAAAAAFTALSPKEFGELICGKRRRRASSPWFMPNSASECLHLFLTAWSDDDLPINRRPDWIRARLAQHILNAEDAGLMKKNADRDRGDDALRKLRRAFGESSLNDEEMFRLISGLVGRGKLEEAGEVWVEATRRGQISSTVRQQVDPAMTMKIARGILRLREGKEDEVLTSIAPRGKPDLALAKFRASKAAECVESGILVGGFRYTTPPTDMLASLLYGWLVLHRMDFDASVYTREQWLRRGEEFGNDAPVTLTSEGPFAAAMNGYDAPGPEDEDVPELFSGFLAGLGLHYEKGFSWSWHVYTQDLLKARMGTAEIALFAYDFGSKVKGISRWTGGLEGGNRWSNQVRVEGQETPLTFIVDFAPNTDEVVKSGILWS